MADLNVITLPATVADSAELALLTNIPAGSKTFQLDTGEEFTTFLGGAVPVWNKSSPAVGINTVLFNDAAGKESTDAALTFDASTQKLESPEFKASSGIKLNADEGSVTIGGLAFNTPTNLSSDLAFNAIHLQNHFDSFLAGSYLILSRTRGTKDVPTVLLDGDFIGGIGVATLTTNGLLVDPCSVSIVADGAATSTFAPARYLVRVVNPDTGVDNNFQMRPNGETLIRATGGTQREMTIDYPEFVNLVTTNFQVNGVNPFAPLFSSSGYTSPVSTGSPAFTAPIVIPYSTKPEGTWTKITGTSSISLEGNISFTSDTVTINESGIYEISVSSTIESDVNAERISCIAIAITVDDTDKPLASLTPSCASAEQSSSQWISVSSAPKTFTLADTDTVKLFYAQVNEGGTTVDDVNIGIVSLYIKKLGMNI